MTRKMAQFGAAIILLLFTACKSEEDYKIANLEREAAEKRKEASAAVTGKQEPATATGRIPNSISIDTTGCLTIEEFDRTASAPASAVPGCIDLDRGTKVVGPLEVKAKKIGEEDFEYARIEVPGNGERWTSLAHLATGRDYYRRELNNLLKN